MPATLNSAVSISSRSSPASRSTNDRLKMACMRVPRRTSPVASRRLIRSTLHQTSSWAWQKQGGAREKIGPFNGAGDTDEPLARTAGQPDEADHAGLVL